MYEHKIKPTFISSQVFKDHMDQDDKNFSLIHASLAAIQETLKNQDLVLKPIAETYTDAGKLKKFGITIAVSLSVIVGILVGIKSLLHK